jgi:hypothetical protein
MYPMRRVISYVRLSTGKQGLGRSRDQSPVPMRSQFRRRAERLTDAVRRRPEAVHVTAIFICPHRGLIKGEHEWWVRAVGAFNRNGPFDADPADYAAMPDDEFARRIRVRMGKAIEAVRPAAEHEGPSGCVRERE